MDGEFRMEPSEDEERLKGTPEEMKLWLFRENIRLRGLRLEIEADRERLAQEQMQFSDDHRQFLNQLAQQRRQIHLEEALVEEKLKIIQKTFDEINADRKALKRREEKLLRREMELDGRIRNTKTVDETEAADLMFRGVNSYLALKKRYRDLMKMFHPDCGTGDAGMVLAINRTYERIKAMYENGKII